MFTHRNFIVCLAIIFASYFFACCIPSETCTDIDGDTYYAIDSVNCPSGNDCDDNNADVYAEAPELCDGVDNQCPGDAGYGDVDEVCIVGDWEVTCDWNCTGSLLTGGTWQIYADGTFYDNYDDTGTWTMEGTQFDLHYDVYPYGYYTGTVVDDTLSGTMSNDDNAAGCWDASRL